jgi:hypothetical protein
MDSPSMNNSAINSICVTTGTTKIIQSFDTIVVGSSIIGGNHDSHENEEGM